MTQTIMLGIFVILIFTFVLMYTVFGYVVGSSWKTLETPDGVREYILKKPKGNSVELKPLVVVLHGYTDTPRQIEFYTGWSRLADQDDFFVVYPKGTQDPNVKKLSWNAGSCCNPAVATTTPDVEFLAQLIEQVSNDLPIDTSKVYLTGFSNGGKMAMRLAAERPELVAAVGTMGSAGGGSVNFDQPDFMIAPSAPVNVVLLHGELDDVVPIDGGYNQARDARFISLTETSRLWAEVNGCDDLDNPRVVLDTHLQQHLSYECRQADLEVHRLKTVGHIWSGWIIDTLKRPWAPQVDATQVLWEFFNAH